MTQPETLLNGRCTGHLEYDPLHGTVLVMDSHDPAGCEHYLHAFRTLFGLPPDTDDQPICGAQLGPLYDWNSRQGTRPPCPQCQTIIQEAR